MYIGDYKEDYATLNHKFTTRALTGIPTQLAGSPVVSVYKGSATDSEKTSAESYITLAVDFDGITGLNNVLIDLSGDAFFAVGEDYSIVITTGTVDGVSVVGETVATFSIENRSANTTVPDAAGTAAGLIGALNDFDGTGATLHSDYDAAKTAAQAGAEMDLVDAPNATAITAIQSGLSTHAAADVWTTGSRELSTPANYKADVSNLDVAVSSRSDGTGVTLHSDYDAAKTPMRGTDGANTTVPDAAGTAAGLIGALNDFDGTGATLHSDYDAAKTAAQAGAEMDLVDAPNATAITAIQSGLSTHAAADVWTTGSRELSTPANYKADVSNLDVAVSSRSDGTGVTLHSDYDAAKTPMRGTDGANTTVPDAAGTAAGLIGALNDFDGTGATLHSDYDAAKTAAQAGDAMTLAAEAVDAASLKADAITAIQSGLSTHDAAAVVTAMETEGSKLDHVWEMTEDDGGTRRLTTNALEQAPSSTGLDAAATRAALGMAAADLDEQLNAIEVGAGGGGDTAVNHDTGGAGNLTYEYPAGTGVGGATVRAYISTEYAAGGRAVRGEAITADDGTWLTDMYLDPGETYVFHFYKNDVLGVSTKTVEIPA